MTPLRVLSMGWGVQSWTIAVMSALGDLPLVDFAVHADTTWERQETYAFAERWTPWLKDRGVRVLTQHHPSQNDIRQNDKSVYLPAFSLDPSGKKGQLLRQCTDKWKIAVTRRVMSLGLKHLGHTKKHGSVHLQLGITLDEFQRARTSDVQWVVNEFPLLDRRLSRQNCIEYLLSHDLPVPPKSSCVFCPYHSNDVWVDLKTRPSDLATALKVDDALRDRRPGYQLYVHSARRPLRDVLELDVLPNDEEGECPGGYCFL